LGFIRVLTTSVVTRPDVFEKPGGFIGVAQGLSDKLKANHIPDVYALFEKVVHRVARFDVVYGVAVERNPRAFRVK
jgi:hypothetical protein